MKHLFTICTFLLIGALSQAQIVFESNFDDWADALPTDWVGTKTSLENDSIDQSTDAPEYGSFLVELSNTESGHKRFTTQPISLMEGESYEVEVWVKGDGEIRTNIYDGDLDGGDFGYGNYNSYEIISGNTLTSFVQVISPDTTSAEQQVILSTRNGVLLIDRVEVRIGDPVVVDPVTINAIQNTTDPDGNSPLQNQTVITSGIVTAISGNSYYIQDGEGAWNGIYVYDNGNTPALGDEVSMEAQVQEYFSLTELSNVDNFMVLGQGTIPNATVGGTGALNEEMFEGVLVNSVGECITLPDGNGEWLINDGSGDLMIGDAMFPFTPVVGQWYSITGPLDYSFGAYKIQPRDAADIVTASSIGELTNVEVSVFPNPTVSSITVNTAAFIGGSVQVIDSKGAVVVNEMITENISVIAVDHLSVGTYMIQLENNSNNGTSTLVVR